MYNFFFIICVFKSDQFIWSDFFVAEGYKKKQEFILPALFYIN